MSRAHSKAARWADSIAYLKAAVSDQEPVDMELSHEDSPVLRDLGNGLVVAYLVDEGEGFAYVQYRDLQAAGVSEIELHRAAIANLSDLAATHLKVQPYGQIFAVFMEGNFEASVLLLDDVWDRALKDYTPRGVVVACPARDVLAFGDAGSEEALSELRGVVRRLRDAGGDHLLTFSLYRRESGQWRALPRGGEAGH